MTVIYTGTVSHLLFHSVFPCLSFDSAVRSPLSACNLQSPTKDGTLICLPELRNEMHDREVVEERENEGGSESDR